MGNIGTFVLIGIAAFILIGAIILAVVGFRQTRENDPLEQRLVEYAARGEKATLEEIELSQPISQRVLFPTAKKMGEMLVRFTPQNALQSTAHKLELAGNPRGLEASTFWALRIFVAVATSGLMFFIFSIGHLEWSLFKKLLIIVVFSLLGFYAPEMLITSKIQRRQKEIRKAMPDALDLLTICVEAGLGFDGALQKVCEKWDNELSLEFDRVLREIQLGKLRRDSLRDMANRIDLPEMTSFIAAIIQSEQLGVSLAKVLRIQSDQMRVKRRQLAEEMAHKAPIKMLIPMALLIFPSICIVLMTPAVLLMMRSALGGILFRGGQ
jgi:tight adherence protein C